ncbi:MAG: (Fe-S)-binding protein [SAR324 cluster bacterium]|nr:(Fe-S)-binding protein [SAR324 cluster bacterium]
MVHVQKIKLEDLGGPIKVPRHTSCHAKREMEIGGTPKQLLGQLKNVELLELEREDECCGFGGTFAIKEQHIYAAMVKDKLDDISKTATNRHLGGECGCLLKISGAMKHFGNTSFQ